MSIMRLQRQGYSLIEVAVVIVLLTILAGLSFQAIMGVMELYLTSTRDYLEVFQEGKVALEKMVRELREANPNAVSLGASSISFTKKTYHDTPQDPNLDITFSLNGTVLERTSGTGEGAQTHTLAEKISSFSATTDNYGVVSLDLTASTAGGSVHLRTAVYPRQPNP